MRVNIVVFIGLFLAFGFDCVLSLFLRVLIRAFFVFLVSGSNNCIDLTILIFQALFLLVYYIFFGVNYGLHFCVFVGMFVFVVCSLFTVPLFVLLVPLHVYFCGGIVPS